MTREELSYTEKRSYNHSGEPAGGHRRLVWVVSNGDEGLRSPVTLTEVMHNMSCKCCGSEKKEEKKEEKKGCCGKK